MEREFVPYDLALELKELGFKEECLAVYCGESEIRFRVLEKNTFINNKSSWVTAPTFSQAFRFFREKYGLHYIICKNIQMDGYGYREVILIPYMEENENTIFKTYEEAEVECLVKLIEIAKEQNVK